MQRRPRSQTTHLGTTGELEPARFFLAAIVESSEDSILTVDFQGLITTWNKGSEHLYGYTADETIGTPLAMALLPADFAELFANLEKVKRGGRVARFETQRRHKDGRLMRLSVRMSPVKDSAGRIIGVSTIARDITDASRVGDELREAERRFRAVFNQQFQFMALLSPEGRLLEVNDLAVNATGISRGEVLGRLFWEAPWWKDLPEMRASWPVRLATRPKLPVRSSARIVISSPMVRCGSPRLPSPP